MKCRGGFLPHRFPCAPPVASHSEWPVGQRIFERGIPHPSAVDNLPWHGFGKICGDERDIDDGKYGMDEGPTRTFDKHVAWRYDDMCGSKYLPTVASLLADKVIREDEIVGTALKQSTRKVTQPAV